jgi:hypothetical protein
VAHYAQVELPSPEALAAGGVQVRETGAAADALGEIAKAGECSSDQVPLVKLGPGLPALPSKLPKLRRMNTLTSMGSRQPKRKVDSAKGGSGGTQAGSRPGPVQEADPRIRNVDADYIQSKLQNVSSW